MGALAELFLVKRANEYWKKRKAPEAMAYYQKAKDYNENGYWWNHGTRAEKRERSKKKINYSLNMLESGRIIPQEGVVFFDGYGL